MAAVHRPEPERRCAGHECLAAAHDDVWQCGHAEQLGGGEPAARAGAQRSEDTAQPARRLHERRGRPPTARRLKELTMNPIYDAIIVGARCAGSPLAML